MSNRIYIGLITAKIRRAVTALILLFLAGQAINANAQTETNLHSFAGSDGAIPIGASLVQGNDGNFYGEAAGGGANGNGTVFRISSSGSFSNLHSFTGSDGDFPTSALVQGSDSNFYGTASNGGPNDIGTVFRISLTGSFTNLYFFGTTTNDGAYPAGLVLGNDGNFYSTTFEGGANNSGTVFRISPTGSFSNLYSFGSVTNDGANPTGLVHGNDGNFYGTGRGGGTNNLGSVFRISPSGSYSNLFSFGTPPDGNNPNDGLVQGSDGNFYGLTGFGGTIDHGTVFRISPTGSYSNLYSFTGGSAGSYPQDGLVQGSDGNFYGTSADGGVGNSGNVFRVSPSGSYTNLYSFGSVTNDASGQSAGLVQGSDGSFYGTTQVGGANGAGTVFKLTVPLNPPPNQISGIHSSATNIIFTIPSVAGETYQLQFSNSMNPTNWANVTGVSVTNSIGALLTLTKFGGALGPQGFYRFDITP